MMDLLPCVSVRFKSFSRVSLTCLYSRATPADPPLAYGRLLWILVLIACIDLAMEKRHIVAVVLALLLSTVIIGGSTVSLEQ
jgi:hypothetical protein